MGCGSYTIGAVIFFLIICHAAPTIKFNKNGTFKILQFTDMHFGEGEDADWGPTQDNNSLLVMQSIIGYEKPDLIVFTGDLITGNNIDSNATAYWKIAMGPAIAAKIPWMIAFGNHDDLASGTNGTRKDLMTYDMTFPLSLSQMGPSDIHGVSNYVVPILSSSSNNPATYIYILDSEDTCPDSGAGWGCILPDQVQWYIEQSKMLQKKSYPNIIPALSFFHIPLQEHMFLWNTQTCYGTHNDSTVSCQSVNSGLHAAFVEMGDVQFVSVGHNHGNDFCGTYDGIQLCFGRHSGYGGYGDFSWPRGGRVIRLTESPFSISTWVRLLQGDVETYVGKGHVPAAPFQYDCNRDPNAIH